MRPTASSISNTAKTGSSSVAHVAGMNDGKYRAKVSGWKKEEDAAYESTNASPPRTNHQGSCSSKARRRLPTVAGVTVGGEGTGSSTSPSSTAWWETKGKSA